MHGPEIDRGNVIDLPVVFEPADRQSTPGVREDVAQLNGFAAWV